MDLARELARSTGTKMERARKLFPGAGLLRVARPERLWPNHANDSRRQRKPPVQNGASISPPNEARARETDHYRRIRMRSAQSTRRCGSLDPACAGGFVHKSLACRHRFLLVERSLAKRQPQKTRYRHDHSPRCRAYPRLSGAIHETRG